MRTLRRGSVEPTPIAATGALASASASATASGSTPRFCPPSLSTNTPGERPAGLVGQHRRQRIAQPRLGAQRRELLAVESRCG